MLKGYKTIVFNVIMTVTMIAKTWGIDLGIDVTEAGAQIDAVEKALMVIWGVGNMWLRAVTDSPIFKK